MSPMRGRPSVSEHGAAVAERGDRLAGGGVQHEQPMPAVEEQAQPALPSRQKAVPRSFQPLPDSSWPSS